MKTIIINENVLKEINEKLEMTEYKFISNIKYFLSKLIADPVNAESTTLLKSNGLNYNPKHYMSDKENTLIKELKKHQIIKEKHKISDRDENGEPKNATFIISYSVPKKDLDRKIKKMYIELFENNVNESIDINEEMGGATATSTVGDYEYDVPTFGDEETLKRGNGVGGSTSINYADNRKNKRNKTIYK